MDLLNVDDHEHDCVWRLKVTHCRNSIHDNVVAMSNWSIIIVYLASIIHGKCVSLISHMHINAIHLQLWIFLVGRKTLFIYKHTHTHTRTHPHTHIYIYIQIVEEVKEDIQGKEKKEKFYGLGMCTVSITYLQ